ncbi:hypothetical protein N7533_004503 [Penicillium manginii]|uniref:uncharacterized protein n=1 Tax=Penicillium manginii TaxID=203109 RepID=UPI0025485242|nr:uncharacterized protein N7533_004503 [Penicillium manginii]KAJ5754960.1 hypothetical protein N7533_004503 [Penicillium manginii]
MEVQYHPSPRGSYSSLPAAQVRAANASPIGSLIGYPVPPPQLLPKTLAKTTSSKTQQLQNEYYRETTPQSSIFGPQSRSLVEES